MFKSSRTKLNDGFVDYLYIGCYMGGLWEMITLFIGFSLSQAHLQLLIWSRKNYSNRPLQEAAVR